MSKSSITIEGRPGLPPVHPGEILKETLDDLELSANKLAQEINVPTNRVCEIVAGKRGVTADTAVRLAQYFGTSPQYWLNLQSNYDLDMVLAQSGKDIVRTIRRRAA
ncbi:MAG: HigA family addiction module antitoxin [Rhodospirillales bacterium]|nr:HigA family addiction module antitoxin [Rhodospirillales bacterium]